MNDKTKIRWYKRDPDAALNGMVGLNLEQRGAYNTIIDLFYSRDGDVPDDDDFICNHLKCNRQRWRRLRTELMELGKLHVNSGKLSTNRAESELKLARKRILSAKLLAEKRWDSKAHHMRQRNDTHIHTHKVRKKVPDASASTADFFCIAKEEPDRPVPVDEPPRAKLFREGRTILVSMGVSEKQSGAVIGKWLKQNPDADGILAALTYAYENNVVEPIGYVTKLLNTGGTNGRRHAPPTAAERAYKLADEARELERQAGIIGSPNPV